MPPYSFNKIVSFDGGINNNVRLFQPDRYKFWDEYPLLDKIIPRGSGLSYAAASTLANGNSISHTYFNRILDFDKNNGEVLVESGITLMELHSFLSNNGYYLPIQPGYGKITIGGCIAADVHGKNPYKDGNFSNQVVSLTLFHPAHGIITLSPKSESTIFDLTCGGYGLSGHIISARLKIRQIQHQTIKLETKRFRDILECVEIMLFNAAIHDITYSWINFHSNDNINGLVFYGSFADNTNISYKKKVKSYEKMLDSKTRGNWLPSLYNKFTINLINKIFEIKNRETKYINLLDALYPAQQSEIYFHLFGKKGFHEYQSIIRLEKIEEYFCEIIKYIKINDIIITLCSCKPFNETSKLLRYSGYGISVALNFPRSNSSIKFCDFLDSLNIKLNGRPNLIKDSRLPKEVVKLTYPEYDQFRNKLRKFDINRIYESDLSVRLEL